MSDYYYDIKSDTVPFIYCKIMILNFYDFETN